MSDCPAWKTGHGGVDRRIFPPEVVIDIKALACELPIQSGIGLSRFSVSDVRDEIIKRGIVTSATRLQARWPNVIPVHLPVHASWVSQIEIYFSVIQRKFLTPNDFQSTVHLEKSILAFQADYQQKAKPFEWKYTRKDLNSFLKRLQRQPAA